MQLRNNEVREERTYVVELQSEAEYPTLRNCPSV